MSLVILEILHTMIAETRLPDRAASMQSKRESSFDELHGTFKGNLGRRGEQSVDVVRHDDKFVEKKFFLIAMMGERFDEQVGRPFAAKDWLSLRGDGGHEEDAAGIHFVMMSKTRRIGL